MKPKTRCSMLVASVLLMFLALAGPAHAGVLVSTTTSCEEQTLEQPFLRWADPASYFLVRDGSFSARARAWRLAGGASVVAENQPYDSHGGAPAALRLDGGGSAVSSSMCVGILHPTTRFFVRNSGDPLGALRVDVLFEDAFGEVHELTIARVLSGPAWGPTLPMPLVANLLPLLPGSRTAIALRLAAEGGSWEVDDVYVDPYRKG